MLIATVAMGSAFTPRDTEPEKKKVKIENVVPATGEMTALYVMTQEEYEKYHDNMEEFKKLNPKNVIMEKQYSSFVAKFNLEKKLNKAECPGGTCCTYYKTHQKCYTCFYWGGGVMLAGEVCETCVGCGIQ